MIQTPEGANIGAVFSDIEDAIKDFMEEPIGFKKILYLDKLEQMLKESKEKDSSHNPFLEFGISEVWFRIWQHDESWIEEYLDELESRITATNSKSELAMLYGLLPYSSGNKFKEKIDNLNSMIYKKMQR